MANELLNLNAELLEPSVKFELGTYEFNNKEQLEEFLKGADKYKGLIVTSDKDYKSSKRLRADLRKVSEVINRHRIDYKAEMMKPIDDFEKEMKDLDSIVQGAWKDVDKSVKDFEQKERDDKQVVIDELLKKYSEGYQIEEQKSWYNRTKKVDDIRREILELVEEAKQAEQVTEVKEVKEEPKVDEPTISQVIEMEATPSQFQELIQEMKRIGVKFVRVVDLNEGQAKTN